MPGSGLRRVILIVMDSVGVGELPDAREYGDSGANTLAHAAQAVGGMNLPNLECLGLGKLVPLRPSSGGGEKEFIGSYGKMAELSKGKDTTTGHWEMMGLIVKSPFPLYPKGFPEEIISEFEKKIGRKTLGNVPASGTEIIKDLGDEHCRTGFPIVYTSADSVFQIAAHEDTIPPEELYRICRIARSILQGKHSVGRVIARPFTGKPGSYSRTERRHDFSLEPFSDTLLDEIKSAGMDCVSAGKIWDIFAGRGFTHHLPGGSNREVLQKTLDYVSHTSFRNGLLFSNLVDFDMLYNHRQDPRGFARSMEDFDRFLPNFFGAMGADDFLMITADHGNDPTDNSTDHCREYVPMLVYGKPCISGKDLGVRKSFADCGQTIADLLCLPPLKVGTSFAQEILP